MSFRNRLLLAIKELGLNRNSFAEKLGYESNSYIYDYTRENPKPKEPGFDFFQRFVLAKTSINIEWLLTGEGDMWNEKHTAATNSDEAAVKQEMERTITILREENMRLLGIVELAIKRGGSDGA